jgi:hypothetical protein
VRCQQCSKFVSQEVGEVEASDPDLSEDGAVTCEVRVPVVCAECSDELKEGNLTLEGEFPEAIIKKHTGEKHELSVEVESSEAIDDYETKDRRGKPIKNPRYQTHLYGATVELSLHCSC